MKRPILITSLLILFIGCKKVEIENKDYEQFKEKEMAVLPETNITTTMVGNALGTSSRNVGELCTHPNIDKWAPKKPYSLIPPSNYEIGGIRPRVHGLWRLKDGSVIYKKPSGGQNDPYRLGDFREYRSFGNTPPCYANIRYPTEIIEGFSANMEFRLQIGSINPKDICSVTNPIKTSLREGYGGIAIAPRGVPVYYQVDESMVFSADSQYKIVQIDSNLFDFYYVRREIEGTWHVVGGTAPYRIEDLSYRDAITVVPFGVEIISADVWWVDFREPTGPWLSISSNYKNNASNSRSFTIKIASSITNNNGTYSLGTVSDEMTLSPGETKSIAKDLSTTRVTQGSNTVSGTVKIFYHNVEVGTESFSQTFTASMPM